MRQRFTFIKTNEVEEDFQEEERVELESVIEDTDIESLEKKFDTKKSFTFSPHLLETLPKKNLSFLFK